MAKNHRRRTRRKRHRRRTLTGLAPGTLTVDESAKPTALSLVSFGPDKIEVIEQATIAQVQALRGKREVLWIDVEGLADVQWIRELGEVFSLHSLALEDSVNHHQQVKVEDYGDHLFLVSRMIAQDAEQSDTQLSMFLGEQVVITLHENSARFVSLLRSRLDDLDSQLRQRGGDFLAYAILDSVLDEYFPLLEQFGNRLDDLEELITNHPPRGIMQQVHDVRVELRSVRRITWQQREAINVMLRDPTRLITDETKTYLRDCHDHTIQLVELLEVDHETCSDLRDFYLSSVSNRMNEIMMVLTIIATIFMPLSFIAGLYGMNFRPDVSPLNMPELSWYFGYPFALGLMVATVTGMLLFFRQRGWIWRGGESPDDFQQEVDSNSPAEITHDSK